MKTPTGSPHHFDLKIHVILAALVVAVASAVSALNDLKIQLFLNLGQTPLHAAARLKKFEIFQYLHQQAQGANLLQTDKNSENLFQL